MQSLTGLHARCVLSRAVSYRRRPIRQSRASTRSWRARAAADARKFARSFFVIRGRKAGTRRRARRDDRLFATVPDADPGEAGGGRFHHDEVKLTVAMHRVYVVERSAIEVERHANRDRLRVA